MNIYKINLSRESELYERCSIDSVVNIDFDELSANDKDELTRDGFVYMSDNRVIINMVFKSINRPYRNYITFREKVLQHIKRDKLKEFLI